MSKIRKLSSDLRDILKFNTYVPDEKSFVVGLPDFITVNGVNYYLNHATARNTEAHYCQQCSVRPSSGFLVELQSHPVHGYNLAAYQCDNCKIIQIMRMSFKEAKP